MLHAIFEILLRCLKRYRQYRGTKEQIAVIAPAPPGSLGDEALFSGFQELVKQTDYKLIELLVAGNRTPHGNYCAANYIYYEDSGRRELLKVLFKISCIRSIFIIGADTIDGAYNADKNMIRIKIAKSLAFIGVPVKFISFSFSDNPHPRVLAGLKELPNSVAFSARDKLSLSRFVRLTGHKCELVSDLAFSMEPDTKCKVFLDAHKWSEREKRNGCRIVGLNINPLSIRADETLAINNVVTVLEKITAKHTKTRIMLIPHDVRPNQSDEELLSRIYGKIKNKSTMFMVSGALSAANCKAVAGLCDLVVTGRMHLAIAALGQSVPVYAFHYQQKFEGLMMHFSLSGNLAPSDVIFNASDLEDFLSLALSDYMLQKTQIENRVSEVKLLSKKNMHGLP